MTENDKINLTSLAAALVIAGLLGAILWVALGGIKGRSFSDAPKWDAANPCKLKGGMVLTADQWNACFDSKQDKPWRD